MTYPVPPRRPADLPPPLPDFSVRLGTRPWVGWEHFVWEVM